MRVNVPLQVIDMESDGYHLLVEVKIGRKKYNLVLDTGASKTVFDHNLLSKANSSIVMEDTHRLSAGLGTLSMESFIAVVPVFKIGRLNLPDFEAAVLNLSTINQAYAQLNHPEVLGVLGGDILMKYKAVIDYGKKNMRLEVSK